jgi:rhodanese-related sulfurtransferase
MHYNIKTYIAIILVIIFFIFLTLIGCEKSNTQSEVSIGGSGDMTVEDITTEESGEEEKVEENIDEVIPLSVKEAYEMISGSGDYIILDVRSQREYSEGHIEGAILIPVGELEGRMDELPKGKPIIVYCKVGGRSASASDILVKNGFAPVYNMEGGIMEWINEGYPTVEGD